MSEENFILKSDCYKESHWKQYPTDTQVIYSYLESRGGVFAETLFFGLQYYLKRYLQGNVIKQWMLDDAEKTLNGVFGCNYFNRDGWQYIIDKHEGKLPIRIRSVREGLVIPIKNVLLTMENTDENLPWLTNFLETLLLKIWYPITVGTLSYNIKLLIKEYADMTGAKVSPFHLNGFGYRGVSSEESAGIGEMGHLVNFSGTDTINGILYAQRYYDADIAVGQSVMATEHSTTTVWGRENEFAAYDHFIEICPDGIISVVADSFNIYDAIKYFGTRLKSKILARGEKTGFAKWVIRPDSGIPPQMSLDCLNLLWKYFGGTINDRGYKVLNPKVGLIYGDGVNYNSIKAILKTITDAKYCVSNIVFGMGGAMLQQLDRDTHKFAFKCCAAKRNGKWTDVYKEPITDFGKNSKRGRLKLIRGEGGYETVRLEERGVDCLEVVFENGEIKKEYSFQEIRDENIK